MVDSCWRFLVLCPIGKKALDPPPGRPVPLCSASKVEYLAFAAVAVTAQNTANVTSNVAVIEADVFGVRSGEIDSAQCTAATLLEQELRFDLRNLCRFQSQHRLSTPLGR